MKKALSFITILFFVSGMVVAGQQTEVSGKVLLDKLNSTAKADQDYARGYITGVYGVYKNMKSVPDDRETNKAVEVSKKYLESNPEKLSQPANKLLREVFEKAFPKK